MLQVAKPANAAKYRDVREVGVLEGGNCLSVRVRDMKSLRPQRGADGIEMDAESARHTHRANRTGHGRPDRAQRQKASS